MAGKLVAFEHITKRFGGTTALNDVSLELAAGEILALLGENGAGKSTLIKSLAGIHAVDEGRILFKGEPYAHRPPKPLEKQPVSFIHQDLGLIEWMSVGENVGLALGYSRKGGLIDWAATEKRANEALALVDCHFDPSIRVQSLSRTEKSLVAIARALTAEADVLVLDEPTASLPADEVERLFKVLRMLKARGTGIIYVSHRLDEIFKIADRVAVLRDGKLVGDRAIAETSPVELVGLIVGREVKELYHRGVRREGKETLAVKNLRSAESGPVSFTARQGEVLGLVGLRGAGQEAAGRSLFGAMEHTGQICLDGRVLTLDSPGEALKCGIGLVARDRTEESVALSLSIRENVFLNPWSIGRSLFSVLSPGAEAARAQAIGADVGLRPNDPHLPVESLSGGNINDLYFDFMGPSLASAGLKGSDRPTNVSAGDGSESAYQRIRTGGFQAATVAEPLNLQGWQLVDELNRAMAGEKWSGYVSPLHVVTKANVEFDGGPKNGFDPGNGYQDAYKKIWGKM